MHKLAKLSELLIGQPMFKLLALSQSLERSGEKIIHFEIGDPNLGSPKIAIDAAKNALDLEMTHYTDSLGLFELRQEIINYTDKFWKFKPDLEQVLVCPANACVDFSIRCISNPGDEVILPDPCFPTYSSVLKYNRIKAVYVPLKPENEFRMLPCDIVSKITNKTKVIIINSPQNPTGSVLAEDDIIKIAKLAEKHGIYLLT
ncbi:uncharacterized protein METZ01_LOCUS491562, partial [marine metagenome]